MNIAVTVFYCFAGAWLVALLVFAIIKRAKLKKKAREIKKEIDDEQQRKENDE